MIETTDAIVVDELIDRIQIISPRDTDEGDVGSVLCLDLCDRRGFTLAGRSPGCPEPQQHVLAAQCVEIELATSGSRHEHRFEVGRLFRRSAFRAWNARR